MHNPPKSGSSAYEISKLIDLVDELLKTQEIIKLESASTDFSRPLFFIPKKSRGIRTIIGRKTSNLQTRQRSQSF